MVLRPRGKSPMTLKAVTDLPEPDSPTTQTISPAFTEMLMFSTACLRSAPEGSSTVMLRTSRTVRVAGESIGYTRLAKRGSSVSRRPSPNMLMASTATARKMPG